MRRLVLMALLAAGTVAGFASGFRHVAAHHGYACACPAANAGGPGR